MYEKDFMFINYGEKKKALDKELKIKIKKTYSDAIKYSKEKSKGTKCWLCHKECSSFCNSHSIPRFILEKIAESGNLENIFTFDNTELDNWMAISGIRNTLTFNLICHDCDNKYFQDIEDVTKICNLFSEFQLNKLAIKILLNYWYTKIIDPNLEIPNPQTIEEQNLNIMFSFQKETATYDVIECTRELNEHIDAANNKTTIKYIKIIDTIIDKEINFACNCEYIPMFDIYGNEVINELTNSRKKDKRFGFIFIVAYPINKSKSHVAMFYRRKYSQYDKIRKQFEAIENIDDKLQAISNIILMHNDKFVLKPRIFENKTDYIDIINYGTFGSGTSSAYKDTIEKIKSKELNLFKL